MSRIFVTGGSGRLGRSVVAGLAEAGHHVISVDRDAIPADQLPAGVVQETGDLLAPGEALAPPPRNRARRRHPPCRDRRAVQRARRTSSSPRTRGSPSP